MQEQDRETARLSNGQLATLRELATDLERIVWEVSTRDGDATARQQLRAEAVRAAYEALASPLSAPPQEPTGDSPQADVTCEHGTAMDVHCCNCHSGFIFDVNHECPSPELTLVQPPAAPQEPEPYGPFFDPCGKCITRTHCAHHDRCLAECVPADLRASSAKAAVYLAKEVDAARAAEAAQHQQALERLTRQAQDISVTLGEAGCRAMPIVDGVRWLVDHNLQLRARLAAVEEERDAFKAENGEVRRLAVKERAELAAFADRAEAERDRLKAALERLRDCDWTIGRGDRMDTVRDIARAALTPQGQSTDGETR